MKHYVVINKWADESSWELNGVSIVGVAHSIEEAVKIFNEKVAEEKQIADENNWEVFTDEEMTFDAGEDGSYAFNHTMLYIQGVM